MRVGLVGFAGGGKSTLFELLTGASPDPAKVHAGQVGMAALSDPRLDFLANLHKPKKITPATVEFLDTPGLLPGTHGDNPQRLALIREGDALLIVLGTFAGGDPAADLRAFRDELLFADLVVVGNRVERLEASVKKARPDRDATQRSPRLRSARGGGSRRQFRGKASASSVAISSSGTIASTKTKSLGACSRWTWTRYSSIAKLRDSAA